jgi:hypothetical protein
LTIGALSRLFSEHVPVSNSQITLHVFVILCPHPPLLQVNCTSTWNQNGELVWFIAFVDLVMVPKRKRSVEDGRHDDFTRQAVKQGITINGIECKQLEGRGIGVVAQRKIRVI